MCNEVSVRHKVVDNDALGEKGAIRVWKTIGQIEVNMPTLEEIIKKDARRGSQRYFDCEPPGWGTVSDHLHMLPPQTLGIVGVNITGNLKWYASSSWCLQWMDLYRKNDVYFSRGFLRNVVDMCHARNDIYGMLETVYAAVEEDEIYEKTSKG
jgi:hypothetical protein